MYTLIECRSILQSIPISIISLSAFVLYLLYVYMNRVDGKVLLVQRYIIDLRHVCGTRIKSDAEIIDACMG